MKLLLEAHHDIGKLHLENINSLKAGLVIMHVRQTLRRALSLLGEYLD